MIRAGELRHRITFQTKATDEDSFGAPVDVWSDFATVWAGIITTGGKEFFAAQKLYAETTAVFKIRCRIGLLPAMRIKYGTRCFDILNINDLDEAHREMLITCKEVI